MAKFDVAPTKTNLLKIKRDLSFAREGYELLDQKRQILVAELLGLVDRAVDSQKEVEEGLKKAFYALEEAIVGMGRRSVAQAALAVNLTSNISISRRGIMGVAVPVVETSYVDRPPYYSLGETSFWLDEAMSKFKEVLGLLGRLAQARISLMRLAREVKRTIRRVNALEKIYLPDYEQNLKYIKGVLEEQERESFFTLKLVKARIEKKEIGKNE